MFFIINQTQFVTLPWFWMVICNLYHVLNVQYVLNVHCTYLGIYSQLRALWCWLNNFWSRNVFEKNLLSVGYNPIKKRYCNIYEHCSFSFTFSFRALILDLCHHKYCILSNSKHNLCYVPILLSQYWRYFTLVITKGSIFWNVCTFWTPILGKIHIDEPKKVVKTYI